ncbi:hypothetical protein RI129_010486 [Pyrocoelia pectoralis]|uniref:Cytochrome P450 n=1 Tax=Pyrocoelia pectoralis TaxID=417401 RepID=A0AAN7VDI7_9COLE
MLFAIVALLFIVLVVGWWPNRRRRELIDKIPGPYHYPILGAVPYFILQPGKAWKEFRNYAKSRNYPMYKVVLFGAPYIHFLLPEDIEMVLSSRKHINKTNVYEYIKLWVGQGIFSSAGEKWHTRRKMASPGLFPKMLQSFVEIFGKHSEDLVERLEEECEKSSTEIQPLVSKCALYGVCESITGTKLDNDNDIDGYFDATHRFDTLLMHQLSRPWYMFFPIFALTPTYRELKRLARTLHNFTWAIIKKKKKEVEGFEKLNEYEFEANSERRFGLLDILLLAKNSDHVIDDEGIREEVDTFLFAGYDTTSAMMTFTLLLLASYGDIQQNVFNELQDVFGDSDRQPEYQDLQNLSYLDKVIRESLRLYPSVPAISRRITEEITTRSGYVIPKDTNINIRIFDIHHDPKLYPDPYKFDPERFSIDNCKNRHPFAYLPFSAGPRSCMGRKFAMLMGKCILSSILRKYQVEALQPLETVRLMNHALLTTKEPIRLKFVRR